MKKFLVFILIFTANICMGQAPSANNHTEISSNYRAELGTGNFVYNIPLFDVETINMDYRLQGNLYYNAQAASSTFTAEGIVAKGWSADFLPTIYRDINQDNSLCDELYYKTGTHEVISDFQPFTRPYREKNDLFEFNIFGLSGSFRLTYESNNTVSVQLVSSNAFVEIIPNCPTANNGDGKIISMNGFTIKDSNGFSYRFEDAEESGLPQNLTDSYSLLVDPNWNNGKVNGYLPYKRAFLLTDITDKYQRTLVQYIYKTYPNTLGTGSGIFNYNQKVIDKIKIIDTYNLVFTTNRSKITNININNYTDQPLRKVSLASSAVIFSNKDNVPEIRYNFTYFPIPFYPTLSKPPVSNQGNYLKADHCAAASSSMIYDNKIQDYSAGLLRSITMPYKGKVNIEYETNTYYTTLANIWSQLNYDYVEVPVTYDVVNDAYSFFYNTIAGGNDEAFYVKFHSTLYTNPLVDGNGNTLSVYPGFRIFTLSTPPTLWQGFAFEDQCNYGERINHAPDFNNKTIVLKRHQGNASNISNVKVYKKIIKPENQRVNYCFGPSVRVKKITNTDGANTVNEKVYSYTDPANDKITSGAISDFRWYEYLSPQVGRPTTIFYKYITIEESGKGKTVYQMNWEGIVSQPFKSDNPVYNPKNIWKYTDAGQLTEHQSNVFDTYLSSPDSEANRKIKKVNSIIKTYEGSAFKTTSTEKVFDTITMLPVYSKIMEETVGESFQENYTYQKLGNAYYQTKVEKFKNSTVLNRSEFEYQQYGATQAYNLIRTKVAKSNLPLETEKEITGYDYGNIKEYKTKDGTLVSQIWGYGNSKMVAELKNVPYSSIATATITAIKNSSTGTTYNEVNLATALNSLRSAHPNGFVTTYTYSPIGITSITDANGIKETYQYDTLNRLYRVLNNDGLIIKEYSYNIRNN